MSRGAKARRVGEPADYNRRMRSTWNRDSACGGLRRSGLLVVLVMLGLLGAPVVRRVLERPDEARVVAPKSDIAAIVAALRLYRLDNQRYPTTEQGLAALVSRPTVAPL